MCKSTIVWSVGLALSLLVGAGCQRSASGTTAPAANPSGPTISVISPSKQSLVRRVEQPGTIRADEETPIFAHVTGYVRKVAVDIDQRVRGPKFDAMGKLVEPGQLLAEIAVPEMEEELKQKQALTQQAFTEIEQATQHLATAEAQILAAEALVTEAKAGLKRAEAVHDRWESESNRINMLVQSGVVDRQTQDETLNQFKAAVAGREEAIARVATAQAVARKSVAERDRATADVNTAKARREVARADLRRQEVMVQYAQLRAPYDGVITRRNVDTGHYLQPGLTAPIFVISREEKLRVRVEVPEVDAGLVRKGAPVTLHIPALRQPPLALTVARTAWSLDDGSRTLRTEMDLPNPDGRLRPGMYVRAELAMPLPESWTIPTAAYLKLAEGGIVFRVVDGKAVRTPVQIGAILGDQLQLTAIQRDGKTWSEPSADDRLAMPAAQLAEGQPIPATP